MTRITMPWSRVSRTAAERRVAAVYVARGRREATEMTDGADLVAFEAGGTCEVEARTPSGELALSVAPRRESGLPLRRDDGGQR